MDDLATAFSTCLAGNATSVEPHHQNPLPYLCAPKTYTAGKL